MPFVTLPEFSKKCPDLTLEEFRGVFGWSSSSLALTLFVYSLIDRPTAEEAKKWQTSFESVLRHKFGIQLFQEFLRSQYGEENLNFWLAVEEYKKLDESSRAERARMIYEDYVSTLSPTEVRHWFPPLFLFYLSRRLCHANFIFHHRQPKRTICGFGLPRSFGRNILELLVYYLMPHKCKKS